MRLGVREHQLHEIPSTPFCGEPRWNFWNVHEWMDEQVRRHGIKPRRD